MVERIESVPLSQIEYANGRALLQYRGELLPLRDDGRVLDEMESLELKGEESAAATVLICGDAQMKVGHRRIAEFAPVHRQVIVAAATPSQSRLYEPLQGFGLRSPVAGLQQLLAEFEAPVGIGGAGVLVETRDLPVVVGMFGLAVDARGEVDFFETPLVELMLDVVLVQVRRQYL